MTFPDVESSDAQSDFPAVYNAFKNRLVISSPADLDGLALWLDASDESTINAGSPVDDDRVSAWADKSANGYDATQGTNDNRPTFKTAIHNGLSCVQFDPTSFPQFMDLATALGMLRNVPGVTVASMVYVTEPSVSDLLAVGDPILANPVLTYTSHSTDVVIFAYNDYSGYIAPSFNRDSGVTFAIPYISTAAADFLTGAGACDTNTQGAGIGAMENGLDVLGPTPDADSPVVRIGSAYAPDPPIAGWTGYLGELIVYDRALNPVERRQLFDYLVEKWGVV
jgi:hypothetical protein